MGAASRSCVYFQKIKKFAIVQKFECCLCNVDVYVCNLLIKLHVRWNELLCSWEIANRHFERKEWFWAASCKVLWEFLSSKWKLGFRCRVTPIIIALMPMFAMYRVKVEQIILFVKILNRYFERKYCFFQVTVTNVCIWLVKNLFWVVNQNCH